MRVTFTDDEIMEAFTVVVNAIAADAGLSDKDRAMLKRWKSSKMKLGGDDMTELVEKANEDFARTVERRERSAIQKADWAG